MTNLLKTFVKTRRLETFLKIFVILVLVTTLILSYVAYKKHADWWKKEVEWVDYMREQKRKLEKTQMPKKIMRGIIDLHKPSIVLRENQTKQKVEENFFRYIESKDVKCMDSIRLGSQHEGGYNVCLSPPYGLAKPCFILSFGTDSDWNFDDAVSQIYKCTVYSYNPKESRSVDERGKLIHYEKSGLGPKTGPTLHGRTKTLDVYLHETGLTNTTISYLRIDVEGDEWEILRQVTRDRSLRFVKQIGFEMHTAELWKKMSLKKDYLRMYDVLRGLEAIGFRRYDHRNNPFGSFISNITGEKRSCCYELYYINTNYMDKSTIAHKL